MDSIVTIDKLCEHNKLKTNCLDCAWKSGYLKGYIEGHYNGTLDVTLSKKDLIKASKIGNGCLDITVEFNHQLAMLKITSSKKEVIVESIMMYVDE